MSTIATTVYNKAKKLSVVCSCNIYVRKFEWDFYPSGFFPRLLVRLMHLKLAMPLSWANAAVLHSRDGDEVAFLHLKKEGEKFCLEVCIQKTILALVHKAPRLRRGGKFLLNSSEIRRDSRRNGLT